MTIELSDDYRAVTLFGKTRRAILSLLFSHPDNEFHLRMIARTIGTGQGAVQDEVKQLSEAGIIIRMVRGNQVLFQINQQCPIYNELRALIMKTTGVISILRSALYSAKTDVISAFVYVPHGMENKYGSDEMNMVVIADEAPSNIPYIISDTAKLLNKEINITVFTKDEYLSELKKPHGLFNGIKKVQRHFVIGNEKTLMDIVKKADQGKTT